MAKGKLNFAFHTLQLFSMIAILLGTVLNACNQKRNPLPVTKEEHRAEIDEFVQLRDQALVAEDGWLNLIGLFWLNQGSSDMGTEEQTEISLDKTGYPEHIGSFDWVGRHVMFRPAVDGVLVDGVAAEKMNTVFDVDQKIASAMEFGTLRWQVIMRGDRIGIRLRDLESKAVMTFAGVDRFPIDISWRKVARFTPYQPAKLVPLANVLGQTIPTPAVGSVSFESDGQTYHLDVFEEAEELFLIFADDTSGLETYGGGRYLYAQKADSDGLVVLDFNKAINPPCVFTPYATCPLPPLQHILPISVNAGERATYRLMVP